MQKRFLVAGVLVVGLNLALAQSMMAQSGGAAPPPGQHMPMEGGPHEPLPKPTNLKVLPKNISPDDLKKIMHGIAGSLGVKCGFCHAMNPQTHKLNFASDAKPDKQIARTMMLMTRDINEKFMSQVHDPDAMPEDKHVTCGTCHRGHKMPPHFVPPPEHEGPPPGAQHGD